MRAVNVGMVGLGTVGGSTLRIVDENAEELERRLGFPLKVRAAASLEIETRSENNGRLLTRSWQEVVEHPEVEIVAELVGGTTIAYEVIRGALERGKPVVTANKELLGQRGAELAQMATEKNTFLSMEASVAGGIPILQVLREGISADRIEALYGILNGTSNFVLTEMEKNGLPMSEIVAEAQRLGYTEANPAADVEGYDARSKLAIMAAFCFGVRVPTESIFREGITRIQPLDFAYAHRLGYTIRLLGAAIRGPEGLGLSVRPSLVPETAMLGKVQGAYNAVWIKGAYGEDTLYYGRGAGKPTGVAVVSDLMRAARDLRSNCTLRAPAFGFLKLEEVTSTGIESQSKQYFIRFLVRDRIGIIARLAASLAEKKIGIDAVLQELSTDKDRLPFVITVEPTIQTNLDAALAEIGEFDFLCEPPLAMPMETTLGR